jgi:hypothetical protein
LESLPGDTGGAVVYDCVSPDQVNRTVWLIPGQEVKDVMVVEGPCGGGEEKRHGGLLAYGVGSPYKAIRRH